MKMKEEMNLKHYLDESRKLDIYATISIIPLIVLMVLFSYLGINNFLFPYNFIVVGILVSWLLILWFAVGCKQDKLWKQFCEYIELLENALLVKNWEVE